MYEFSIRSFGVVMTLPEFQSEWYHKPNCPKHLDFWCITKLIKVKSLKINKTQLFKKSAKKDACINQILARQVWWTGD